MICHSLNIEYDIFIHCVIVDIKVESIIRGTVRSLFALAPAE